jgi:hypothetical protein
MLNIKKIKSTNNFEKKKTMWENIVAIYIILKEKNYKAKFLTSSIFKK